MVGDGEGVGRACAGADTAAAAWEGVVAVAGDDVGGGVEGELLSGQIEDVLAGFFLQQQVAVGVVGEGVVPAGAAGDSGEFAGVIPGERLVALGGVAADRVAGVVVGV
ncbi:hypothetical protein ACLQ24_16970 [Micromonospora sp. DT4]|uniref:hypothetical protein n=1 Tax=Micromonospora sp. DT4 TaxID=3393438 RepID=UPI003CECC626